MRLPVISYLSILAGAADAFRLQHKLPLLRQRRPADGFHRDWR